MGRPESRHPPASRYSEDQIEYDAPPAYELECQNSPVPEYGDTGVNSTYQRKVFRPHH